MKIDPIIFFDSLFIIFIIVVLCLIAILIYEKLTKNKGKVIYNKDELKRR